MNNNYPFERSAMDAIFHIQHENINIDCKKREVNRMIDRIAFDAKKGLQDSAKTQETRRLVRRLKSSIDQVAKLQKAVNEAATDFVPVFSRIYQLLYDGKIPEDKGMINAAEKWMGENSDQLKALVRARGDLFTSDRELNALALVLNLDPVA